MGLAGILVISYLVGAIPTALLAGKALRRIDIREHGSRNAGATNAWRVLGWKAGLAVLVVDLGKGVVAAALVSRLPVGRLPLDLGNVSVLCGVAAVVGHVFPVYVGFRGGKGVATAAGMLLATAPLPTISAAGVFLAVVLGTGFVSLGSILAGVSLPALIPLFAHSGVGRYPPLLLALCLVLLAFILFTHRRNLVRLARGTEPRFAGLPVWKRRPPGSASGRHGAGNAL